jgi:hypothetical protein
MEHKYIDFYDVDGNQVAVGMLVTQAYQNNKDDKQYYVAESNGTY